MLNEIFYDQKIISTEGNITKRNKQATDVTKIIKPSKYK